MCPQERGRVTLGSGRSPAILSLRDGADDEGTRRVIESDGEEDHLVGGGRNRRGVRPDDAAVAGPDGGRRLRRLSRPAQGQTERTTHTAGYGGGSFAAVSGRVLRPEHPAFSREAGGQAQDPSRSEERRVGKERRCRGPP